MKTAASIPTAHRRAAWLLAAATLLACSNAPSSSTGTGAAHGGTGAGGASATTGTSSGTGGHGGAQTSSTSTNGSSSGDAGDAGDAGGCMLPVGDGGACEACMADHCCMTESAFVAKPASAWTASAKLVCSENACSKECGVQAVKCGGITPDPASCLAALQAKCCDLLTACGASDACLAVIYLCIDDEGNAPGTAAFDKCAAKYPGGLAVFDPLNTCFNGVSCP